MWNGSQFVTVHDVHGHFLSFPVLFPAFYCFFTIGRGCFSDHVMASNHGRHFRLKQISQPLLETHLNRANQGGKFGSDDIELAVDQV